MNKCFYLIVFTVEYYFIFLEMQVSFDLNKLLETHISNSKLTSFYINDLFIF